MPVHFYLEKRTDKQGNAPIRVSVSILGARFVTSVGYKVAPSIWNEWKERHTLSQKYSAIKSKLLDIEAHFAAYETRCRLDGTEIDSAALRKEFTDTYRKGGASKVRKEKTFFDIWAEFTNEVGTQNQWTKATYQKFDALKNHLQDWNEASTFESLNEEGITSFVGFLRDTLKMRNSTIGKQIGFLKWFLRWAMGKGYNEGRAFLTYSPKLKTAPKKVVFLDWDELMSVYNYIVPANGTEVKITDADGKEYTKTVHDAAALEKTRDIFCFCCFTSLRYSDAANLKRSDIGNGCITLTTIKTADTITIELNKYAASILAKYEGCDFLEGKALPAISNQRMNEYLKELCELCGINKPVTQTYYRGNRRYDEAFPKYALIGTHTGRRTFICNALMLGISPQIVMKWTGHSDYKSMKPYIDVTDAAKASAMEKFNEL